VLLLVVVMKGLREHGEREKERESTMQNEGECLPRIKRE